MGPEYPVKNLLVTGMPGCGKTTLVKGILPFLEPYHPAGFYTQEIREKGKRVGFSLVSTGGERAILAHVQCQSRFHVGKYGVDIGGFEKFLATIPFQGARLVVIDEIGKMESLSGEFRRIVDEILASPSFCLATIAARGTPWIEGIKKRDEIEVISLDRGNAGSLARAVVNRVRTILGPG
ncbi:MAG: hypothetical protein NQU46_08655 [Methanolinea sp.]|nr:hypothetical protein [Methanolinea sp.]